jgi:hypothetical protein
VIGLIAAPLWLHLPGAIVSFWAAAAVLLLVSAVAMRQQLQNRPQASAATLLLGLLVLQLPLMLGVMPVLEGLKISPALARAVRQQTGPEVPVATFGYGEPSLNFYVGRPIEPLAGPQAVAQWARQPQAGVLIVPRTILAEIEQQHGSLGLREIASKAGLNYAKGKTFEVAALLRRGDHRE